MTGLTEWGSISLTLLVQRDWTDWTRNDTEE